MISPVAMSRPVTGEEKTYRLTWGWRDEGRRGIKQLKETFGNISSILRPHQLKKEIVAELESYVRQVKDTKFTAASKLSTKLLQLISKSVNKSYKKYHLIKMKHNYLSQIAHSTRSEQDFLPPIIHSFEKLIPIRQSSVMVLYMTRNQIKDLTDRVWTMEQTLSSYRAMQQCKSFYHLRVDGCPKCNGIVYRGVLMVKVPVAHSGKVPASPSIATATTLINLQQAQEDLQISCASATRLLQELRHKYDTLINSLQLSVIYNIQHWFSLRYYYVHFAAAKSKRFDVSKFYYRIRRLVKMKGRVDAGRFGKPADYILPAKKAATFKFPPVISLQKFVDDLEYDFSDVLPELQEYLQCKSRRRQVLVKSFHDLLLKNLGALRSRAAWAAQVAQQQAEKEAEMKQRLREAEERFKTKMRAALLIQKYNPASKFRCPRYECAGKTFKSHDRLQMHLNWHKRIEMQMREKQQLALQWSSLRGRREKGVLQRIEDVRTGVKMCKYHAAKFENIVACGECSEATPVYATSALSVPVPVSSPQKQSRPYWLTLSHDQFNKKLKHFGVNMKINMQPGGSRQRGENINEEMMLQLKDADVPALPAVTGSVPSLVLPHLSSLTSLLSHSYFFLELVSKHISVTAPPKVSLHPPTTHIGSAVRSDASHIRIISAQINFSPHPPAASPSSRKQSTSASFEETTTYDDANCTVLYDIQTGEKVSRHVAKKCSSRISPLHCIILVPDTTPVAETSDVHIIDNLSAYGTYIVNQHGCVRAATTVQKPSVVKIGDLICIGVNRHLPSELAPIDANKASVVYRLRKV